MYLVHILNNPDMSSVSYITIENVSRDLRNKYALVVDKLLSIKLAW